MKAVCVKPDRSLEIRDVPTPTDPPADHLLVEINSCGINHGDKAFLALTPPMALAARGSAVWGASAVGRVIASGAGVPESYAGKRVAIYRSLRPTPETIGLWCERAQVHHLSCLILPDEAPARDYCGSLVNVITAYAFLQQAREEGHRGIVVTAGGSATGQALIALTRGSDTPLLHLVRSASARDALQRLGAEHVLVTSDAEFRKRIRRSLRAPWRHRFVRRPRRRHRRAPRAASAAEFDILLLRLSRRPDADRAADRRCS